MCAFLSLFCTQSANNVKYRPLQLLNLRSISNLCCTMHWNRQNLPNVPTISLFLETFADNFFSKLCKLMTLMKYIKSVDALLILLIEKLTEWMKKPQTHAVSPTDRCKLKLQKHALTHVHENRFRSAWINSRLNLILSMPLILYELGGEWKWTVISETMQS